MRTAVMYGAGAIGRGFIGQLLSESGYEVVFVDVNDAIVARLEADRSYPVRFVSNARTHEVLVRNVRAVHGADREAVAGEIAKAEVIATAVGVNALPLVAGPLAAGLHRRWEAGNALPQNVLICENLIDAHLRLRDLVAQELAEGERGLLDERVGFVEASIGRMVPVMSTQMQEGNVLRVWVEEHAELPVDGDAFRGKIPAIRNLVPASPFALWIKRKLYIHNLGHAMTAYLGQPRGYRYVWEAAADAELIGTCRSAMGESARALSAEYRVPLSGLLAHVEDLITRFGNRQLSDTLDRVGRDLLRKLSPGDRLVGALYACQRNGVEPRSICAGIAAALRFRDPAGEAVARMLQVGGPAEVLTKVCGLEPGSWAYERVLERYAAGL
ncbi:MAG TPA: hypothetical protein VFG59_21430 [Anaeromyxobacter sp.]|nr:hypothetical protein [Anaeromyxobacter sp.]